VTAEVDVDPNSFNQGSGGNWVKGTVELPAGLSVYDVVIPTVLAQRAVPVAPGAPVAYGDENMNSLTEADYKFDRTALSALVTPGNSVPVEIIGRVADDTWFRGLDFIRVLKPKMKNVSSSWAGGDTIAAAYPAGSHELFEWGPPEEALPDHYDLWYSSNDGESWILVEGGIQARAYSWTVPAEPTEEGRLELVAVDARGPMGSWISDRFHVTARPRSRTRADRPSVRAPSRGNPPRDSEIEVAPPSAGVDVRVYDVRGTLVRTRSRGFPAGRYLVWTAGRRARVGAGVPVGVATTQGSRRPDAILR
jgi:hypothetical protein